jgi:hypothetical protein
LDGVGRLLSINSPFKRGDKVKNEKELTILNLGSGKVQPLDMTPSCFLVNLDSGYYPGNLFVSDILEQHKLWLDDPSFIVVKHFNADAFTFLEKYPIKFDRIVIYRFLEHVARRDVLYFIYLMSTSLESGGIIDCIVPDYELLAHRILSEKPFSKNFEAEDIITTTELLNEPSCPHASIWTPKRIKKFFELEKRFILQELVTPFYFDGRSIYLRAIIERR